MDTVEGPVVLKTFKNKEEGKMSKGVDDGLILGSILEISRVIGEKESKKLYDWSSHQQDG